MKNILAFKPKKRQAILALSLLATSSPVFAQIGATNVLTTPAPQASVALTSPAPVTTANISADARELIEKAAARYSKIKSYSVVIETRNDRPNPKIQSIQYRAPQEASIKTVDVNGNLIDSQLYTTNDSTTLRKVNDVWEYRTVALPDRKEGQPPLANLNIGGQFFPSLLSGLNPFREGSRYQLESLTVGEPSVIDGTRVNTLVAKLQKSERSRVETTVIISLGKKDSLVRRIQTDSKLPNGQVSSSIETHSKIDADANFSDATFAFAAPEGAKKVEAFSRTVVKATVGQPPLAINTKDVLGKDISFEQYKGKVVLVDFWATWCGPCIAELPNVKTNYAKYKDQGFDVLGISLDRTVDPLNNYIKTNDLPWRQIFDGYWDGPLATSFNVRAIPSTLLIGKDGKVAAIGVRGEALEPAIKAALAQ